jgi:hypothetical protein
MKTMLVLLAHMPFAAMAAPAIEVVEVAEGDAFVRTQQMAMAMDMDLTIGGVSQGTQKTTFVQRQTLEVEVLAEGQAKLVYVVDSSDQTMMDDEQHLVSPRQGKTYLVDLVRDAPLDKLPEGEFDVAGARFDEDLVRFSRNLPTTRLKHLSADTSLPAEALLSLLGAASHEFSITDARISYEGVDKRDGCKKCAAFQLAFTVSGATGEGGTLTFSLDGRVYVDLKTGWTMEVDLEGPLALDEQNEAGPMALLLQGRGTVRLTSRLEPAS